MTFSGRLSVDSSASLAHIDMSILSEKSNTASGQTQATASDTAENSASYTVKPSDKSFDASKNKLSTPEGQRQYARRRKALKKARRAWVESLPPLPKRKTLMDWLEERGAVKSIGGGRSEIDCTALNEEDKAVLTDALTAIYGKKMGLSDVEIQQAIEGAKK